ncbi:MAG: hypothetical protein E7470_06525 [Ruminococcaceae bacterium]|nr:hypothetical protein [Oscillospiraceae bacterium]
MQNIPIEEAMKLAATPQGQLLLQQLQEQHGTLMQSAIAQAQSGDYDAVKKLLSGLLNTPQGKALLDQLKG